MATNNFWGNLVRSLRQERKITQRSLALEASVCRSTLRRIESGDTSPNIETMERILNYLGCDLEVLDQQSRRVSP